MVDILPTVKLRHKRSGRIKIINQTDYARDPVGISKDWKAISWSAGNAPDDVVERAIREEEAELRRRNNPKSPAFGDPQRAFEARSIAGHNVVTEPAKASNEPPPRKPGRPAGVKNSKPKAAKPAEHKAVDVEPGPVVPDNAPNPEVEPPLFPSQE